MRTPPAAHSEGLTQVNVTLQLRRIMLLINDVTKETETEVSSVLTLQWRDPRLVDPQLNPCIGIIGQMLSMTAESAEIATTQSIKSEQRRNLWVPVPEVADKYESTTIGKTLFALNRNPGMWSLEDAVASGELTAQTPGVNATSTVAQLQMSLRHAVKQVDTTYYYYPFDVQVIRVRFLASDFNISTCGTANFVTADFDSLLPPEIGLSVIRSDVSFRSRFKDILKNQHGFPWQSAGHQARSFRSADGCTLEIAIDRDFSSALVKEILPGCLIVLVGLLGSFLDPKHPPLMGGRVTLILVAILLVITQLARTSMKFRYLTWLDVFSLVQMGILCLALCLSIDVHLLIRAGKVDLAMTVDQRLRMLLLSLYTVGILGLLLYGAQLKVAALAVVIVGSFLLVAKDAVWIVIIRREQQQADLEVLGKLADVDPHLPEGIALLRDSFKYFDKDKSGDFSVSELRIFTQAVYPAARVATITSAMDSQGWVKGYNGSIDFNSWTSFLQAWDEVLRADRSHATQVALVRRAQSELQRANTAAFRNAHASAYRTPSISAPVDQGIDLSSAASAGRGMWKKVYTGFRSCKRFKTVNRKASAGGAAATKGGAPAGSTREAEGTTGTMFTPIT
jgi:hypothetical protein